MSRINIHNIGTFFQPTGYAKVNRSLILEMVKQGASITFTPCVKEAVIETSLDNNTISLLNSLHHKSIPDDHIVLFNFIPNYLVKNSNNYHIGLTMFECNRLPLGWEQRCNQMDEIWVPSTFNYQTFMDSGVLPEKLKVMPLGVNTDIFRTGLPKLEIQGKRSFAFLMLSSGGWDARKGCETLLRAFFEEFDEEEDVCLIMKIRASSQEEILQQQRNINQISQQISGTQRESVILISTQENWADERIAQLYNTANCYVLPTHGEGWNMTAMEAMATGLPVITTNWSAHLDFINNNNGYLIDIAGFEKLHAWDTDLLYSQPNKDHLKHLMRHVYTHQSEAIEKGIIAQETVATNFTWAKSAERMMNRMREI